MVCQTCEWKFVKLAFSVAVVLDDSGEPLVADGLAVKAEAPVTHGRRLPGSRQNRLGNGLPHCRLLGGHVSEKDGLLHPLHAVGRWKCPSSVPHLVCTH